jgi:hypothetical protein
MQENQRVQPKKTPKASSLGLRRTYHVLQVVQAVGCVSKGHDWICSHASPLPLIHLQTDPSKCLPCNEKPLGPQIPHSPLFLIEYMSWARSSQSSSARWARWMDLAWIPSSSMGPDLPWFAFVSTWLLNLDYNHYSLRIDLLIWNYLLWQG